MLNVENTYTHESIAWLKPNYYDESRVLIPDRPIVDTYLESASTETVVKYNVLIFLNLF